MRLQDNSARLVSPSSLSQVHVPLLIDFLFFFLCQSSKYVGKYATDVPVGFYTHVIGIIPAILSCLLSLSKGLGASPDDVEFTGSKGHSLPLVIRFKHQLPLVGVFCEEGDYDFDGGALDTVKILTGKHVYGNNSLVLASRGKL